MGYIDEIYKGMLPAQEIKGHRGYYPVCSKEEWEDLPAVYKAMDWEPVKDPFDGGKLKAVTAVVFDVPYIEPYRVSAKVSVHPQEVHKILFCSYKDIPQCHLYSVVEIELAGGTKLGAQWLQDSVTGAFGIVLNGGGPTVARQGGYQGYIPKRIKVSEAGKFEYDSYYRGGKTSHYQYSNPFRSTKENSPEKALIDAMMKYGMECTWTDEDIIFELCELGITRDDFINAGYGDYVRSYFEDDKVPVLTNEGIIENAKATALRDGYNQFIIEDSNGDYSFTRCVDGVPVTPLLEGEKIVGKVMQYLDNGVAKAIYEERKPLDAVINNAAKSVRNDDASRSDDEFTR